MKICIQRDASGMFHPFWIGEFQAEYLLLHNNLLTVSSLFSNLATNDDLLGWHLSIANLDFDLTGKIGHIGISMRWTV